MKAFNLKQFLVDNREVVIASFNRLQGEILYNGCTLKSYMTQVMIIMELNCKTEKAAKSKFEMLLSSVYYDNFSKSIDYLQRRYKGTQFEALV